MRGERRAVASYYRPGRSLGSGTGYTSNAAAVCLSVGDQATSDILLYASERQEADFSYCMTIELNKTAISYFPLK